MKKKNDVLIRIKLAESSRNELYIGKAEYRRSNKNQDCIEIYSDQIEIKAQRFNPIDPADIFYNYRSTLHTQIIKTLVYYFSSYQPKTIEYIEIQSKKKNIKINCDHIIQPRVGPELFPSKVNKQNIQIIFLENEKAACTLISLSYLLAAVNQTDPFLKFEKLWRSFNKLFMYIGKGKTEFDSMIKFKQHILTHNGLYSKTIDLVKNLSASEIRKKLRLQEMIRNNYPKGSNLKAYKEMISRYSDKRIMEIFEETLPYKEKELKSQGYYVEINTHIQANINGNIDKPIERISFLTLIYMYFVRNKLFHGEKIDSTFRLLDGKEHEEMEWLCEILFQLNVDVINANHTF
ncbi:hypothetical protein LEP1GSC060_0075 [Leptospira weilii serovar Ranarum str. ICFT]|uniref:Apea-like HEPN domain-containing protein n=1 Tax=Leptospira weilii serovar Ranarum str. ICFT TaxID=1218598 RepID=N1WIY5_9LEPT|nr:hypothetical protein [Leptospira weilii]EMY77059.1 hypothetical protein LEP1GSC060_0075 [Leptospira weilii serovar Ranarum str. ICFT]